MSPSPSPPSRIPSDGHGHVRAGSILLDLVLMLGTLGSLVWFSLGGVVEDGGRRELKDAADFLIDVRRCQIEYFESHGQYADRLDQLDLRFPTPVYFDIHPIELNSSGWRVVAVQAGPGTGPRPTRLQMDQDGWIQPNRVPHLSTKAPNHR